MGPTVISIQEFRRKWGYQGPNLLIQKFIKLAPEFPGDVELAETIGEMIADLESALRSVEP